MLEPADAGQVPLIAVGRGEVAKSRLRLAKICQSGYFSLMTTMNISLPETLKQFVDQQVAGRGYGTSSEYVRELIRKDQDRQRLRGLLLEGADSPAGSVADAAYFDALRRRARSKPAA